MGVLMIRALLFWVCTRASEFGKSPLSYCQGHFLASQEDMVGAVITESLDIKHVMSTLSMDLLSLILTLAHLSHGQNSL